MSGTSAFFKKLDGKMMTFKYSEDNGYFILVAIDESGVAWIIHEGMVEHESLG